jgi:Cysteine rich repeat
MSPRTAKPERSAGQRQSFRLTPAAGRFYQNRGFEFAGLAAREGTRMRIHQFAIASALSLAAFLSAESSAPAQQAEAMRYCKADVARLCPGVQPGGGRIIGCLKAHKEEMSIGCGKALQAMKAKMGQ